MSELMAKALLAIGQGMHGRDVRLFRARPTVEQWSLDHDQADVRVELVERLNGIDIWVNGDFIETSATVEQVSGVAIAHLLEIGLDDG